MTNNLISNIHIASTAGTEPEVGMGATICHYTDRSAATVVAVRREDGEIREIDVRGDKATRTDTNGVSDAQSYSYEPGDPDKPVQTWRYDSKGRLRQVYLDGNGRRRMSSVSDGPKLALGIRDTYYDYSF